LRHGELFRDREFLKTPEDLYFCIVGDAHPRDRVISYLRYFPSPSGLWGRGDKRYARAMSEYSIPNLLRNIEALKERNREYVFYSDVFGVEMSAVPVDSIAARYLPQVKLREILRLNRPDPLQSRLAELATYLSDVGGVPLDRFGVTGSMLIDLHNPDFSDIDLTVEGGREGFKVRSTLLQLYSEGSGLITRVPKPILRRWTLEKSRIHPVTLNEAEEMHRRQWNYGSFRGTVFSIHPVRAICEIHERYGDKIYRPTGMVRGRAVISDASESLFLPHRYGVEGFRVEDGVEVRDIREVTSYIGFYGGIFEEGEEVSVYGKLEEVQDTWTGEMYYRVLVGSPEAHGRDYIKPA